MRTSGIIIHRSATDSFYFVVAISIFRFTQEEKDTIINALQICAFTKWPFLGFWSKTTTDLLHLFQYWIVYCTIVEWHNRNRNDQMEYAACVICELRNMFAEFSIHFPIFA